MGDANPLLHHCMENILLNGSVNLNIDKDPRKCRAIFRELSGVLNKKLILDSVKSIVLPTNNFTSEEEDIILCIIFMKNVEVCTLCGGRRGSDGKAKQGGLQNLPRNFGSLTQITHLDLSFNIFTNMPECLFVLENLNTLNLDFNHIKTIPPEIHKLSNLEELYFRRNNLSSINVKISCLQCLKILNISSNQLNELPNVFHLMKSLRSLDFSNNRIGQLPENLFCSDSLDTIRAGHNYVETLPPGLCDSNVEIVDVRFNCIVELDDSVKFDNRVLLKGNLPKSNRNHDSSLDDIEVNDYDVPIYVMESDISSFSTSSEGCYELPSGVRITIPKHFTCSCNEIYCNVSTYEDCNFSLQETDQLLSVVLHLMPNGLHFEKPIKISIPYTFSGFGDQKREIVIRVVSSDSKNYSEDLRSDIINHHEEPPSTMHGEVTALIAHFSKFAVVSRLVQNTIVVDKNSQKTLFSSVDPFTKLRFPEGCVTSDVNVTLQILSVNPMDVDNITASSNSYASNILSVDVKPSTEFKQPITVHLALPYLLMGKQFNKRELRLMKCKNDSEEWNDITENVDLVFSTVDVSFQVQSFSKFWLVWSNVCGVLRKVYRRIITYDVQFLAMQQKTLPSRIIAQCVRSDLMQGRINQLVEQGYRAGDCSTAVQKLMEGDQFKVKVIGDLQIKQYSAEDKRHIEERVLVKRFYSQYSPEKSDSCRFFVEPVKECLGENITGYISFYKIYDQSIQVDPSHDNSMLGEGCNNMSLLKKRPFIDKQPNIYDTSKHAGIERQNITDLELFHLDDVLVILQNVELPLQLSEEKQHVLFFGELGTGMFKESNLRYIASEIGIEWQEIGHYLGLRTDHMDRIRMDFPGQARDQIFQMLKKWAQMHMHEEDCMKQFTEALIDAGRTDLAEKVKHIYEEGSENFRKTIKRRKEITTPEDF